MDLAYASRKWGRKTAGKGSVWKANTTASSGPCEGLRRMGISACNIDAAWRQGVDAVSPSDFDASIAGKENKWMTNFERGVAGR